MPHKSHLNGSNSKQKMIKEHQERRSIKLWRSPVTTLYYFFRECIYQFSCLLHSLVQHKILVTFLILSVCAFGYLHSVEGSHSAMFAYTETKLLWWSWWVLLGFLSSCGFGSGLHTFVLYLGPFIAQVTMSAFVCRSLDFPEPPYPEKIICPDNPGSIENIKFFKIVQKVQIESILWGFGTAIGELPPYFMARGARLSSRMSEREVELFATEDSSSLNTETVQHNEEVLIKATTNPSTYQRLEILLQKLVMRAGFFGIVICASVPNPLFDLAGMTCGHFLVPFTSFFGATFIGKALIKVHLQQFAVIAVSSDDHIDSLVRYIGRVPVVGAYLQPPFMEYLQNQKEKLHNKTVPDKQTWVQLCITLVVTTMMLLFIVSIVNAMAQNYHRRQCDAERQKKRSKSKKTD